MKNFIFPLVLITFSSMATANTSKMKKYELNRCDTIERKSISELDENTIFTTKIRCSGVDYRYCRSYTPQRQPQQSADQRNVRERQRQAQRIQQSAQQHHQQPQHPQQVNRGQRTQRQTQPNQRLHYTIHQAGGDQEMGRKIYELESYGNYTKQTAILLLEKNKAFEFEGAIYTCK